MKSIIWTFLNSFTIGGSPDLKMKEFLESIKENSKKRLNKKYREQKKDKNGSPLVILRANKRELEYSRINSINLDSSITFSFESFCKVIYYIF